MRSPSDSLENPSFPVDFASPARPDPIVRPTEIQIPLPTDADRSEGFYTDGMRRPQGVWNGVLFDVVPAVTLLVLGLLDVIFGLSSPYGHAPKWTALPPQILACAMLLLRRRRPLLTLTGVLACLSVPGVFMPVLLTFWGQYVPWLAAMYSVGRHVSWPRALWALPLTCGGYAVALTIYPAMRVPGDVLFNGVVLLGLWGIGLILASLARSRQRGLDLEFERGQAEARAATRERNRIAAELHDVISHTITVIVMQAGGARLAAAADPSAAVAALQRIENLGRDSLAELRTMLRVLDGGEDESTEAAPRPPQPGLSDVPRLCEELRQTGARIDLRIDGDITAPRAGTQLVGFRIVQESLTNVLKHASASRASVRLTVDAHELRIEVSSPLRPAPPSSGATEAKDSLGGSSRGLNGLRTLVDALGGTLSAGPAPTQQFLIHAMLPLTEEPPT